MYSSEFMLPLDSKELDTDVISVGATSRPRWGTGVGFARAAAGFEGVA